MSRLFYNLFVNRYNYTDFHELNLDWLISDVRVLAETLENFININTIKYADPIQWNITTQYEANTVVIDANDGTAYISIKPVPSGVAITNTDYWTPIFTLNLLSANQNITFRDDASNVLATFASVAGDWLIWNNNLYKVSQNINVNEAYVVGYNIDRYSVELFIKDYIAALENKLGDLNDLDTTDKSNLVAAINELYAAIGVLSTNIGNLNDLKTMDKDSVVDAINEVVGNVAERTEDIFNVKSLNLDFTQDITSDVETLLQTHKRLYFPAGDYYFSITIRDRDVEIFGDGFYMLTKFHPTTGACITLDARSGVNCGNFKLHDVSIIGSNRNYNGIRTIGEYDTDPIDNVMIRDVYINDCDEGIYWNSRGIWGTFEHVWCHMCKRGLYVQMPNDCAFNHNQFNNCFFGYNRRQGVYIIGTSPYKINSNEFLHCTFEANFVLGHDNSDYSNVLIYANATAFLDCYFEGEDGACDIYASHSDFTVRGGVSIVPKGTFCALISSDCYGFIIGLHGYQTSAYKITDSGSYNNHCVVIGKTNTGYLDNGAYVVY